MHEDEERQLKDGTFVILGTIYVHDGGTLGVSNAVLLFGNESLGIIVEPGATTNVVFSVLQPEPEASSASFGAAAATAWGVDVQPGSVFRMETTDVYGGKGVALATSDALVERSSFQYLATALTLTGSSAVVKDSLFQLNDLHVHQTGGSPTLSGNTFLRGETCVRNYRTNPTIDGNSFIGCHTGIDHLESHSSITNNLFKDDGVPPGAGVNVGGFASAADGGEPEGVLIEGNVIENHGTGLLVVGGRAFIRNNTIVGHTLEGVRVEDAVASMDITGNTVGANGGAGIRLVRSSDVTVADNAVSTNGGDGVVLVDSPSAVLRGNVVAENAGAGIVVDAGSAGAALSSNVARENAADGIALLAPDASLDGDAALANGGDGVVLTTAGAAVLARVNASGNGGHGLLLTLAGELGDVALVSPRAIGNGGDGLLNAGVTGLVVEAGWFEDNVGFGVRTDPAAPVVAQLAYWGSALGPFVPILNEDGDEASEGVVYMPFSPTPPA